ncbi:hypothetical protein FACS189430_11230 [Bacteroidia bacterium]|nr:hypothetical protein FACS189430_11230 [Bacteroidia bacterium]
MKRVKLAVVAIAVLAISHQASAQSAALDEQHKVYIGAGFGFDYGGFGAKVEYLPTPLVPIHSSKFNDNYKAAQNDPNLNIQQDLSSVGFSIGYNFAL